MLVAKITLTIPDKDKQEVVALKERLQNLGVKVSLSRLAVRGIKDGLWWLIHEECEKVKQEMGNLDLTVELEKGRLGERLESLARLLS
jgi:hypothetical protein